MADETKREEGRKLRERARALAVTSPHLNDDVVVACMDLVGRAGASGFEIGYLHDDVPVAEAGWYAHAQYQGARLIAQDHQSPTGAALALAERLLAGATCRCLQPVTLSDGQAGCRWRLVGQRWEPACDVASIKVSGARGDHAAMRRALAESGNRAQRRAAKRKGGRHG
ncbi:hypothetical protein [Mangrovihabitans endophyticus]|uniref:Uncharacterized protein n=1 Tax=Mangrovihabitans endophyticus TaxID=1751298 RepID=A0A8J3BXS6_9ACTN|nr:hypothetical protein [Mangrovihabitans endophyticus]GGK89358.1 hypothetical protein GCM10012284_24170 [Mangrovihabitans endophyticus]